MPVYHLSNTSETHPVPRPPGGIGDGFARVALTVWASSTATVEALQWGKTQRSLALVGTPTAGQLLTRYPIDPEITDIVVTSGTDCHYSLTWTREAEPLGDLVEEP